MKPTSKMRYDTDLKMEQIFPKRTDKLCRRCGGKLVGRQRSWCGDCSRKSFNELMIAKGSSTHIRQALLARDKGVCANCKVDCVRLSNVISASIASARAIKSDIFKHYYSLGNTYLDVPKSELDLEERIIEFWQSLGIKVWSHLWEADHILEVVNGGKHSLDNLQTLCISCHKNKTRNLYSPRREVEAFLPLFCEEREM